MDSTYLERILFGVMVVLVIGKLAVLKVHLKKYLAITNYLPGITLVALDIRVSEHHCLSMY